jgi:hypothetical protein
VPVPFAKQAAALDRPWALAAAGRCRALLQAAAGDLEAAQDSADAALAAHERVPLPFERARTLLVAGSVHRRLRRRREARVPLDDALAEFTRLGATAWADRARAERRRIGGRAGSPQELTDAERRIAERVAAGPQQGGRRGPVPQREHRRGRAVEDLPQAGRPLPHTARGATGGAGSLRRCPGPATESADNSPDSPPA